jgi:hypothetical protein
VFTLRLIFPGGGGLIRHRDARIIATLMMKAAGTVG